MRRAGNLIPAVAATAGVAALLYSLTVDYFVPIGRFVLAPAEGSICPLPRRLLGAFDNALFQRMMRKKRQGIEVVAYDFWRPLARVQSGPRRYWLRRGGLQFDERDLLAYLEAEHEWIGQGFREHGVRYGDTVADVGAHAGVFTRAALEHGAARVIAIEPDPANAECLRRNLQKEIEAGRVTVVEKGAWSRRATLPLAAGVSNSGSASLVLFEQGAETAPVPVDTLDAILTEHGFYEVDLIKIDVEGAEREVLLGARETLRRQRPRLILDGYHRADDSEVLPRIVREANPAYRFTCGPCEISDGRAVPHTIFFN